MRNPVDLIGATGFEAVTFRDGPVQSHVSVAPGASLSIGGGTVVEFGCGIACEQSISIGADCFIGPYVQVLDSAFHTTADHRARPRPSTVSIGDGVVIGPWSIILPGATVPDGARIPAGTTVTRSSS